MTAIHPSITAKLRHALGLELQLEAERYTNLAKDAALKAITNDHPESPLCGHPGNQQLAREHLIRAETFKAAAAIVDRKS